MQKQIKDFEWDDVNIGHIIQHSVEDFEVEYVILFDKPFFNKGADDKYIAYGITEDGRYLFIVFLLKKNSVIRAITARDMIHREKRYYEEKRK